MSKTTNKLKILVPDPKKLRDLGNNQGYKYPEDYMVLKRKNDKRK